MKNHYAWRSANALFGNLTPKRFERVKTKIHSFLFNLHAWVSFSDQNKDEKNHLKKLNFMWGVIVLSNSFLFNGT